MKKTLLNPHSAAPVLVGGLLSLYPQIAGASAQAAPKAAASADASVQITADTITINSVAPGEGAPSGAENKIVTSGTTVVTIRNGTLAVSEGAAPRGSAPVIQGMATVTVIGPDGKSRTVQHDLSNPSGAGLSIPGPDGKPLAVSVHTRPARMEKVSYLGVMVAEAPEILSKHLPVPAGIGLVVLEAKKDSPAQKGGLLKDDVLLRFDDQLLANAAQLRTLTRAKKAGDKIRLSVLQKGTEKTVEITVEEHEEDTANMGSEYWQPLWAKGGTPNWLSSMREKWLSSGNGKELWDTARKLLREAEEAYSADEKRPPGPPDARRHADHPEQPPGLRDKLERLEEDLAKLRAEINRQKREHPERRDPRGPEPREGREGRDVPSSPKRPVSPPPPPTPGEK